MGRYRPPRPQGANYITPEGEAALRDELHQLWHIERPSVTQTVHEAAKNGDRSENGDYIYGKRRLREIDSRVRFISKRLEKLTVVNSLPDDQQRVFFGAWVSYQDTEGELQTIRIVGPDEIDLPQRLISIDSPIAKAMIGKRVDDEIRYASPSGEQSVVITDIKYRNPTN